MENLTPATPEETAMTLAFALRFEGKRRIRDAEETMARITAERLVKHLELSGYVLMKKLPPRGYSTPDPHQKT